MSRGITADGLEEFLNPTIEKLKFGDDGLPGIVEATNVILSALETGREIVVFGDYDCDGVCASAIVMRTLRALIRHCPAYGRSTISSFLPNRLTEGYGMTEESITRLLSSHPSVGLVVTVDNGINSVELIARLKSRGISVVITDHHLPSPELPAADAIVNPKVKSSVDHENLCGAGVAFYLSYHLLKTARERGCYDGPKLCGPLVVLAGLATITDVMPVTRQNRIIVSEALKNFEKFAPAGLKALYRRAGKTTTDRMTSRDFGFLIGPRINAAGRLNSADIALELLECDDPDRAAELAQVVDGYNLERKQIEQDMFDQAWDQIVPDAPAQLIDLPTGHPGIAGIVAARLMDKLSECSSGARPVCVIASGRGSARSPAGINIRDVFQSCSEYLDRFGGHAAAAGFSVKEGMVDAFREKLCEVCRDMVKPNERLGSSDPVELWLDPIDITLELSNEIARFEPFGEGNPIPVFGLHDADLFAVQTLGSDGRHLQLTCRSRRIPRGIWWNHGDRIEEIRARSAETFDLHFTIETSTFGPPHPELRIRDVIFNKSKESANE